MSNINRHKIITLLKVQYSNMLEYRVEIALWALSGIIPFFMLNIWTNNNLNDSLNLSVFNTKYDYVSLLIGVNNQYRGLSSYIFEKEFRQLLNRSINYSKNKSNIFVLSIPDCGVTPFADKRNKIAVSDSIDVFNQLIKKVCFENSIKFFDITDISREAKLNSDLIASDSLHPSGIMYKKWIDKILLEWKI